MFGHEYGPISYFQNVGLQKKIFSLVWKLKLARFSLLECLFPLMLRPFFPPKKMVITYVIRLLDHMTVVVRIVITSKVFLT